MQSIVPPVVLGTRFAIVDAYLAPVKLRFALESVEKLLNDIKLSKKILKFKIRNSLEQACVSAYNYFMKNNLL